MIKKLGLLLGLALAQSSEACTVWASIGAANQSDQLLLVKNRDAPWRSWQQLQLIHPPEGYRYLALMYQASPEGTSYPYLSAGINQAGLNIVDNDIATATPYSYQVTAELMTHILQHYDSVAAVLRDQQQLFTHGDNQNFLIADKDQVIDVEVAPDGHYAIFGPVHQGYLFHTNHYVDEHLIAYNVPVSASTFLRYNRINTLLTGTSQAFTASQFETFAKDQTMLNPDGSIDTNDNILRHITLATWLIAMPKDGPPVLHLQEMNPQQPKRDIHFVLNSAFWQQS